MAEQEESFGELNHVLHAEEINKIVGKVVAARSADEIQALFPRFKVVFETYQEHSQLLDPYLHDIVQPLATALRDLNCCIAPLSDADAIPQDSSRLKPAETSGRQALASDEIAATRISSIGKYLWEIASVRGSKTVIKLFPHQTSDLEPTIHLLLTLQDSQWEIQCVLLLWLSQLITLPFNLALMDSSLSSSHPHRGVPPLVASLVGRAKELLSESGSSREMSARLLGRLLTRPDTEEALQDFMHWALENLRITDDPKAVFLSPGCLQAISEVLGRSSRAAVQNLAPQIWRHLIAFIGDSLSSHPTLTRKLIMKLIQRLGVASLPPDSSAEDGEEDFQVPADLEDVVEWLLNGLCDADTVVRWSAAKGLGRITARLPKELGDEVVGNVMELFEDELSDTAWHGACLCLAELSRRTCLPESRFSQLGPLMVKALQMDIRRGPHSVGAHIRDAAAYVCWALARAYDAAMVKPLLSSLAPALLTTACYDREVNCRRAAAAAFQEIVGRQGSFPYGITILTAADYFTLSSKTTAYMEVATQIAAFPEYGQCMRSHLLETKLKHWEASLRELASKAFAALVPTDPLFFTNHAIGNLLDRATHRTLETRHGAVLGAAEVVLASSQIDLEIPVETLNRITGLPMQIERERFLLGKGGELMRCALCRYIACIAQSRAALAQADIDAYQRIVLQSLSNASQSVQIQAVEALTAVCKTYASSDAQCQQLVASLLNDLKDQTVSTRRGAALALGVLPAHIIMPYLKAVLQALVIASQVEGKVELRDADTRVNAVNALVSILLMVLKDCSKICNRTSAGEEDKHKSNGLQPRTRQSSSETAPKQNVEARDRLSPPDSATAPANGKLDLQHDIRKDGEAGSHQPQAEIVAVQCTVDVAHSRSSQKVGTLGLPESDGAKEGLDLAVESQQQINGYSVDSLGQDRELVMDALKEAMKDYTVNNRGDVGSWVREAAMRGLTALLVHLLRSDDLLPTKPAITRESLQHYVQQSLCLFLQQAVERIGRVRETATEQALTLMAALSERGKVAEKNRVHSALAPDEDSSYASYQALCRIASLLQLSEYRRSILLGLVFSIGGIDAPLSDAASQALIAACSSEGTMMEVCKDLLSLWECQVKSTRLAVPFLKTADVIISNASGPVHPFQSSLSGRLMRLVCREAKNCKNLPKLSAIATILCHLLHPECPEQKASLTLLVQLLVSDIPRVRQAVAEQLYLQMLASESEAEQAASEILLETAWNDDIETAAAAQSQLKTVLSL